MKSTHIAFPLVGPLAPPRMPGALVAGFAAALLALAAPGALAQTFPDEINNKLTEKHRPMPAQGVAFVFPDDAEVSSPRRARGGDSEHRWLFSIGREEIEVSFETEVEELKAQAKRNPEFKIDKIQTFKVNGRNALYAEYLKPDCKCNAMLYQVQVADDHAAWVTVEFMKDWNGREAALEILNSTYALNEGETGYEKKPFRFEPYKLASDKALGDFSIVNFEKETAYDGLRYTLQRVDKQSTGRNQASFIYIAPLKVTDANREEATGPFDCEAVRNKEPAGWNFRNCETSSRKAGGKTQYLVSFEEQPSQVAFSKLVVRTVDGDRVLEMRGDCRGEAREACIKQVDAFAKALRWR
ncbi:MAG: hypothetical protein R3C52_01355 [Hyphomonadaceae bacterium]